MAVIFPLKFGFLKPSLPLEFPPAISNNKARCSEVALRSQKSNAAVKAENLDQQTQIQPLIDLLHDCADRRSVREAKSLHAKVLKLNFPEDKLLILLNHVAHAYSKCSCLSDARLLFDKMPQRNVFSWTVMISSSTEHGSFLDGFKYFLEMLDHGILPDAFSYSSVIKSCIGLDSIDLGEMVHAQIIIRGFTSHIFVSTSILNMYAKLGKTDDSFRVFSNMEEHNQASWSALISGFLANDLHIEALKQFDRMIEEGVTPNKYTLASVMKAIGKLNGTVKAKQVHEYVSELGMDSDVFVGTALIDMYSKCGDLSNARSVLDTKFINCGLNMPWNAMITGLSNSKHGQEALQIYAKMCQNNVKPDVYTFCSVFNAISDTKSLKFAREVHGMVLKTGFDSMELNVENAILDAYSKCNSLEDANKAFEKMEERDVVSWTTMVTAYSQCSEWDEALKIFSQMRENGFAPDEFTLPSVLVACANLCFLEYGRQIHALVFKTDLNTENCIESALINMYAKSGSIMEAEQVFKSVSNPNVVSWTVLISGYAQHGYTAYALELFKKMEQIGVKPNNVTLLCVLFACSHGGLVEEGLEYFRSMKKRYGVTPDMEHYACAVDLLGRVGHLDAALDFIEKMDIKPNVKIWETILAACRVHGNVELGERVASKIISVMPEYPTTHVLLSNAYMENGSSAHGIGLRKSMKKQGIKKQPGYSWVLLNGRVHKFYSGDQNHPQKDEIYAKLEDIMEKIKDMGYVRDLRYA